MASEDVLIEATLTGHVSHMEALEEDEAKGTAVLPDAAASPPSVDPMPPMADVLSQGEHLRRDSAETDAARCRVETPKPLANDIEWIERQYAAGGDWSFIVSRMDQARPYVLPCTKYDNGHRHRTGSRENSASEDHSLAIRKKNGNASLEALFGRHEVDQILQASRRQPPREDEVAGGLSAT